MFGVRYIAINDNVDTDSSESNDLMPFKNLFKNCFLRRDLSRGVSAKKTHLYLLLLYLRAHSGTHENIFNLGLSFSNSAWTA